MDKDTLPMHRDTIETHTTPQYNSSLPIPEKAIQKIEANTPRSPAAVYHPSTNRRYQEFDVELGHSRPVGIGEAFTIPRRTATLQSQTSSRLKPKICTTFAAIIIGIMFVSLILIYGFMNWFSRKSEDDD
ncbi:hypothetical protein ABW19_dt0206370 [Dactylella cylindrospora]|nr:hypothetical protein ABW19_dt0206370 [Dactylella cylindrospora]